MDRDDLVVLQTCPDHVSADALATYLKSQDVPAIVHDNWLIPGIEQGTQVLVPASFVERARALAARQPPPPDDAELTYLATGQSASPDTGAAQEPDRSPRTPGTARPRGRPKRGH